VTRARSDRHDPGASPSPTGHPSFDAIPRDVSAVADYEELARARLTASVWRYLAAGSDADWTLAANRRAFDERTITPRPLADVRDGHTNLSLFGQRLAHPLLLAPVAYQRLFHPEGERASAMAAAAQGGQAVVSSLASQPLEEIARAFAQGGGTAPWFQLYWQGERARTLRLLRRAEAAGFGVVVFTVDAPVKLATLRLDESIGAVNLEAPLAFAPTASDASQVFDGWMAQAPTWDDLDWLREQTRQPLVVKGILHPDDAGRCLALGCDGLVVSNHGGRVLDGAPASLAALPAIVERVAGRAAVILDSGLRDGRDVAKALTAGAQAVMIGRPYVWGLACAGAMGVAHVLRMLRDELEAVMALCGHATLDDFDSRQDRGAGRPS
jgi:4-hydroxymandelate oxidase